ncbi:MAG: Ribosome hibernation protein YhbH [Candidatus Curtissbacteria bacterium GW2011_GWA1_40_9]|uniref:Ribosome hibernation protein YhbH n=1 Tax=Candidatus Curtissbacteria bacterium GW2011_GWA1_40_9 TaxID=1618408 RepID=A0A0G0TLP6_9BACT|nr:MAG: Ribosome hibernation protein YhbH [Candidatus Curtissbacteria bacterium GW2011_GWA1_40_9]
MKLTVTTKRLINSKKAKDYAKEKISKLSKYNPKIEKIAVWLIGEKSHRVKSTDFICEIKASVPGRDLEIKGTDQTIEAAIDKVEDRAKRLLVKNKERHLSKQHKQGIKTKIKRKLETKT